MPRLSTPPHRITKKAGSPRSEDGDGYGEERNRSSLEEAGEDEDEAAHPEGLRGEEEFRSEGGNADIMTDDDDGEEGEVAHNIRQVSFFRP